MWNLLMVIGLLPHITYLGPTQPGNLTAIHGDLCIDDQGQICHEYWDPTSLESHPPRGDQWLGGTMYNTTWISKRALRHLWLNTLYACPLPAVANIRDESAGSRPIIQLPSGVSLYLEQSSVSQHKRYAWSMYRSPAKSCRGERSFSKIRVHLS